MRRGIWALVAAMALVMPGATRAASITLVFEESSALDYVVSYLATGDGPLGGEVAFDVDNGTSFAFNTALFGTNVDETFSITYTSVSSGHDWLGVRANEGFLLPGLPAGPLTLGTLSVCMPLAPVALAPVTNDPTAQIHRVGENSFGDTYSYTVLAGGAGGGTVCEAPPPPPPPPPPGDDGDGEVAPPDDTGSGGGGGGGLPPDDGGGLPDPPPPLPPGGGQVQPIPEASSVVLFGVGLLVAAVGIRRSISSRH